jgi:hypothetical protein
MDMLHSWSKTSCWKAGVAGAALWVSMAMLRKTPWWLANSMLQPEAPQDSSTPPWALT